MPAILRPFSLGLLLDETFDIYRRNFLLFLGISAIPNGALLLIQIVVVDALDKPWNETGIGGYLAGIFFLVATLLVPSIVTAATTFAVSDVYLDRPASIRNCFSRVSGRTLKVLAVSVMLGLVIGLGLLLCVAPGVYWAGVYGVAIPAVVLENIPIRQALPRSSHLTRNFIGRVIVVYFLTSIFAAVMRYALNAGLLWLWPMIHPHLVHLTRDNLRDISSTVAKILFRPVSAIGLTLLYYDLRVRKEAFDLDQMMALIGGAENVAAEDAQRSAAGSQ